MKNMFFLLLFFLQILCSQAANVSVSIHNSTFDAISNTLNVGDIITWTNNDGFAHTVTSITVPTGAAAFNGSVAAGATFQYTITEAGSYTYRCIIHTSMTGSFTVAGITTPAAKPILTIHELYPNPCVDYVHIESAQNIQTVDVYSEAGVLLQSHSFSTNKIDVIVSNLEKGIYFIRIKSAEGLVETRRIIKS